MKKDDKKKILEDLIGVELKTLPLQFGLMTMLVEEDSAMYSGVESIFHSTSRYVVRKLYKPISKMIKQSV
jgi:hypothetical protein